MARRPKPPAASKRRPQRNSSIVKSLPNPVGESRGRRPAPSKPKPPSAAARPNQPVRRTQGPDNMPNRPVRRTQGSDNMPNRPPPGRPRTQGPGSGLAPPMPPGGGRPNVNPDVINDRFNAQTAAAQNAASQLAAQGGNRPMMNPMQQNPMFGGLGGLASAMSQAGNFSNPTMMGLGQYGRPPVSQLQAMQNAMQNAQNMYNQNMQQPPSQFQAMQDMQQPGVSAMGVRSPFAGQQAMPMGVGQQMNMFNAAAGGNMPQNSNSFGAFGVNAPQGQNQSGAFGVNMQQGPNPFGNFG